MTATSPSTGKRTLADEAYTELKSRIMRSELAPGAKLSIDGLAKELAFSHTPIRESLARLESEGLLARRPLSGYTVEPLLSEREFADLFEIRMLLEPLAARRAAERAVLPAAGGGESARVAESAPGRAKARGGAALRRSAGRTGPDAALGGGSNEARLLLGVDGFGDEAAALLDRARTPPPEADKLDFTEADARFHNAVAELSGSVQLAKAIRRLDAHLHLHRAYIEPESIGETEVEHLEVAEAIIAKKPLAAEEAMRRHLERSRTRHRRAFEAAASAEPAPKPKRAKASR
ncbi:GntR family transcriptional regulator [Glycomyces sp. TRM65418]|uniref:GntR family transcriptional regulator n=1 Tax=Glycomyces sp. TRM65418 TaxID=2867006 RepID=UPI001CE6618A|nr:GntR family transcriptional regulator [Glycomyces sp. TRM65418]MCC3764060.1 GntR family transcriptional regulator [Glycomyces sp. TRM65418]QZD53751.1 GntR family transcriptional regulator [Glycomyces sp. TRM65418]